MTQEPEEKKHFTVRDRRRISRDDEARPETTPAEAPEAAQETAAPPPPPTVPGVAAGAPVPGAHRRIDFGGFVVSLAAQAAALLADQEHAAASEEGAREIIAILEMLQEKTEGRRSEDETRLLEDGLFQLRMAFVSRPGSSGR